MGHNISDRGGIDAMQANYYTLFHCTPLTEHEQYQIIRNNVSAIQYIWDGVGQWGA
ncbi:MAG: hypothetical protein P4L31_03970 [Candidatus Babeliales bacterium]|nr:hypothetical protein [Candidatus Babeliales bacterium]